MGVIRYPSKNMYRPSRDFCKAIWGLSFFWALGLDRHAFLADILQSQLCDSSPSAWLLFLKEALFKFVIGLDRKWVFG